jgi:hypothetical protein
MIFRNTDSIDETWEIIAKATANNELGIAAKVAPQDVGADERGQDRLICVYTADFRDIKDVRRVADKLKQLGLISARGQPLYYKPGRYSWLELPLWFGANLGRCIHLPRNIFWQQVADKSFDI